MPHPLNSSSLAFPYLCCQGILHGKTSRHSDLIVILLIGKNLTQRNHVARLEYRFV